MAELLDVTVPMQDGMAAWPEDERFRAIPVLRVAQGQLCNLSTYHLSSHVGTHIDPPFHFLADGRRVDQLRPEELVGPCWVADLSHLSRHISAPDLEAVGVPQECARLLLKTSGSAFWAQEGAPFPEDFIALTPDAGRWLLDHGVRLVGIDTFSVDPYPSRQHEVHHLLLGADAVIVENLDLRSVEPGSYELLCLPLKVKDGDGAPCRVLLRR